MNLRFADTWPTRALGLLWGAHEDDVLVLRPCNDVHTCFMRRPVDLAFADSNGRVIKVVRGLAPWRRARTRRASLVLERFARPTPWPAEGDLLPEAVLLRTPQQPGKDLP